jgi:hypothetical protein
MGKTQPSPEATAGRSPMLLAPPSIGRCAPDEERGSCLLEFHRFIAKNGMHGGSIVDGRSHDSIAGRLNVPITPNDHSLPQVRRRAAFPDCRWFRKLAGCGAGFPACFTGNREMRSRWCAVSSWIARRAGGFRHCGGPPARAAAMSATCRLPHGNGVVCRMYGRRHETGRLPATGDGRQS